MRPQQNSKKDCFTTRKKCNAGCPKKPAGIIAAAEHHIQRGYVCLEGERRGEVDYENWFYREKGKRGRGYSSQEGKKQ